MAERNRPHIHVPNDGRWRSIEPYTPHGGGGGGDAPGPPPGGRPAHAAALKGAIEKAVSDALTRQATTAIDVSGAKTGLYLEFESFPGWELAIGSLENQRAKDPHKRVEVVAVSERTVGEGEAASTAQVAAVFVPEGEVRHFLSQLERYALTTPKKPHERRHENVYDRINELRLATLRALWTDDASTFPARDDDAIWWELWLRRTDGDELERLHDFAGQAAIILGQRRLQFDDRIVTLAYASPRQLTASLSVLGDFAELRRAKETATFFVEQDATGQTEWVTDLVGRTTPSDTDAPAVCVLDTGVNAGHPLLDGSLAANDCHAVEPVWGRHDHDGHGTMMAGLALFGDLVPALEGSHPVALPHRLESVKILPPTGKNAPDLYGAITADATSRPEIQAPQRRRVFSMAVTTRDSRDRGQPTSWSSALDALAAGRSFDPTDKGLVYLDETETTSQRLFVVSAGNVEKTRLEREHLDRSDLESVEDPAQAWNALTVGAYTDKVMISDPSWHGWSPVASRGDLSPWSTTSVTFAPAWPIKPDIVMEGGNVVHDGVNVDFPCDDLCLLTTYFKHVRKPLVTAWATSASTAQAARLCAVVTASNPAFWPEMVRGLIVHSAEWTPAMRARFGEARGKTARAQLVRRYGFGVPSLDRALLSAANAVTLLVQDVIRPFSKGAMREIRFHALPWPREALAALGETTVRVRVTLSYFIEPNPGRRGWKTKHRYQSHGLQFEVKRPAESDNEFRKRLNSKALNEDEGKPTASEETDEWYLGPKARNRGSLHSDILCGLAANIAERGVIAVFPVTGWWKDQMKRDRSELGARYALIVSIETESLDADIWTPIAVQLGIPIET